jgi:hypothetical protein
VDTADGGMTGGDREQHVHEFQAIHRGDPRMDCRQRLAPFPQKTFGWELSALASQAVPEQPHETTLKRDGTTVRYFFLSAPPAVGI